MSVDKWDFVKFKYGLDKISIDKTPWFWKSREK